MTDTPPSLKNYLETYLGKADGEENSLQRIPVIEDSSEWVEISEQIFGEFLASLGEKDTDWTEEYIGFVTPNFSKFWNKGKVVAIKDYPCPYRGGEYKYSIKQSK